MARGWVDGREHIWREWEFLKDVLLLSTPFKLHDKVLGTPWLWAPLVARTSALQKQPPQQKNLFTAATRTYRTQSLLVRVHGRLASLLPLRQALSPSPAPLNSLPHPLTA